jgi:hypothetical protein
MPADPHPSPQYPPVMMVVVMFPVGLTPHPTDAPGCLCWDLSARRGIAAHAAGRASVT